MNTAAMPSLSLQAHLVSLQPKPAAVSVDPRGFKTALQSFIQFLVHHRVPATLWVKLPKDDAWWQDIWLYGQQAAGCTIYSLGEQTGNPPDNLAASLRPIPIGQADELKREYLCLAVADSFVGSLLAARVPPGTPTPNKRTLLLYGSVEPASVFALSKGIKAVIEDSLTASSLTTDDAENAPPTAFTHELANAAFQDQSWKYSRQAIACAAALSQWDRCFPANVLSQKVLPLSANFLTWQLQVQEDLRSQITEYRNSAKTEAHTGSFAKHPSFNAGVSTFLNQAREALQSPLTTIKTALTLLSSPNIKLPQQQRYLEMIANQCEHQHTLINDIVDLLQLQTAESVPAQPINLADILPGIVSTYQPLAAERGITLVCTLPADLPKVLGVEAELRQVLIHLIKNGIQITPEGKRVWVAAATYGERFIALTVQDSGKNISRTDMQRLFEAFARTPNSSNDPRTGLGTTLVQQLVKRMGGSISVDSTPISGTTFTILLPARRSSEQVSGHTSEQPSGQPSGQTAPITDSLSEAATAKNSLTDRAVNNTHTKQEQDKHLAQPPQEATIPTDKPSSSYTATLP